MRFILVVIAALASSISAMPADVTGAAKCPTVCHSNSDCSDSNCGLTLCHTQFSFCTITL
ncbi:hypothetical protein BDR03DRAFT_976515 [Suillus americanus]|nr:hypothetical protein BDR03DRAFT_976515 [Suillus americanus]